MQRFGRPGAFTPLPGVPARSEEALRRQLVESFAHRARLYQLILDELRAELGAGRAEEVPAGHLRRGAAEGGGRPDAGARPLQLCQ